MNKSYWSIVGCMIKVNILSLSRFKMLSCRIFLDYFHVLYILNSRRYFTFNLQRLRLGDGATLLLQRSLDGVEHVGAQRQVDQEHEEQHEKLFERHVPCSNRHTRIHGRSGPSRGRDKTINKSPHHVAVRSQL